MKRFVYIIAVAAACLQADTLFAWGPKGHDIIVSIAEQHLTKRAKKEIDKLTDGKSIVYYASWMDELRNSPEWEGHYDVTMTWHFANVDKGETYESMKKNPAGDVITATYKAISELKSGTLNDSMRVDHLKMIIHMLADMHCPMHAGRLSDRGGNDFRVYWFGEETNLHYVWDVKLIESARTWSYSEWRTQLDTCDKKEIKRISAGTPSEWFSESVAAAANIYDNVDPDEELSYKYIYDNRPLLEKQLLYAGYRLAAVLNNIFG